MKLIPYNEYLVSTVDIDGLVLQNQGIESCGDEYPLVQFLLFMGLKAKWSQLPPFLTYSWYWKYD